MRNRGIAIVLAFMIVLLVEELFPDIERDGYQRRTQKS
jgi:hypothetical protein